MLSDLILLYSIILYKIVWSSVVVLSLSRVELSSLDEQVPMSVFEPTILPTSSMYLELVHSLDSVSLQEHQQDMFSRLMLQEMPLGKQQLVDDGDSLEMLEPIQQHSSSEHQIIKISYSRETISNHSVSLVHQGISSLWLMQQSMGSQ